MGNDNDILPNLPRSHGEAVAELTIDALAAEHAALAATNAQLIDVIADLAFENFRLSLVADYRLRHNPDLLDTLTTAAKYGQTKVAA